MDEEEDKAAMTVTSKASIHDVPTSQPALPSHAEMPPDRPSHQQPVSNMTTGGSANNQAQEPQVGDSTEPDLTPGGSTEHGQAQGGSTEHGLTPSGNIEHDQTPVGSTKHDLTPCDSPEHDMTAGVGIEHDLEPSDSTKHDKTPGISAEHDLASGVSTEHDLLPGVSTEHDLMPGGSSEHDVTSRDSTRHLTKAEVIQQIMTEIDEVLGSILNEQELKSLAGSSASKKDYDIAKSRPVMEHPKTMNKLPANTDTKVTHAEETVSPGGTQENLSGETWSPSDAQAPLAELEEFFDETTPSDDALEMNIRANNKTKCRQDTISQSSSNPGKDGLASGESSTSQPPDSSTSQPPDSSTSQPPGAVVLVDMDQDDDVFEDQDDSTLQLCSNASGSGQTVEAALANGMITVGEREDCCENSDGTANGQSDSVDQKSHPENESRSNASNSNVEWDMAQFAEKYYNVAGASIPHSGHVVKNLGTLIRRKSSNELPTMQDMLKFSKTACIATSHIRLQNSENCAIACSTFKDICKYMKGELKADLANVALRGIVSYGIERVELRDEIYCQLIRQSTDNPHKEWTSHVVFIMCLCAVSFAPSHTLLKYLLFHVERLLEEKECRISSYAEYCLRHLKTPLPRSRRMPPSVTEIQAIYNLHQVVCRIHFLDMKTKAVGLGATETAHEALEKVAAKVGLQCLYGWALFESTPERDRHIKSQEYLTDVMSDWEQKQRNQSTSGSPRRGSPKTPSQTYGKFVFCKRVFQPISEIPYDPIEFHLRYAQAVHYVVRLDDYSVSESMAVQLAGLQAQVIHGEYEEGKESRYIDIEEYICPRLITLEHNWSEKIAQAHKKYGSGKTVAEAEMQYLSQVSDYPLYACCKFYAHYKGLWTHGIETILAFNHHGFKCISIKDKTITFDYHYAEIETILLDAEEYHLIVQLRTCVVGKQQCYMFECLDIEDIAELIEHYSPHHAKWLHEPNDSYRTKITVWVDDCPSLADDIIRCRCNLVSSSLLQKTQPEGLGFIRTALKRLGGRCDRQGLDDCDLRGSLWSFSRSPFKQSLLAFDSAELEDTAVRMFNSTLVYAGLEAAEMESDLVGVVQTLVAKCIEREDLCNEFYLQLIKQTTEAPPDLTKVLIHYWHLLGVMCNVILPPSRLVHDYLTVHLASCAMDQHTEEGQFAQFCIKGQKRVTENGARNYPPSHKEIVHLTQRHLIQEKIHLQDGHYRVVEFDSSANVEEVLNLVKATIGMRLDARGFGLFECLGGAETCMNPTDKLTDFMFKWEKMSETMTGSKDMRFAFKKRLFIDPFINLADPVEADLVYHQSVSQVFEEKIPMIKADALQLCALRAQSEFGDYLPTDPEDYVPMMRILPRHLRELINASDIASIHKSLTGMTVTQANLAFMDILKNWPLYGATIFEVTQAYSESLPKVMWLGVSQMGLHLMERKGQMVYSTYSYKDMTYCVPSTKNITVVIGSVSKGLQLVFTTAEATQISQLLNDYSMELIGRRIKSDLPPPEEIPSCSPRRRRPMDTCALDELETVF